MKTRTYKIAMAILGLGIGIGSLVACNSGGGGSNSSQNATTLGDPTPTCVNGVCYYNYGTPAQYITSSNVTFQAVSGYKQNNYYGYGGYSQYYGYGSGYGLGSSATTVNPSNMTVSSAGYTKLLSEVLGICNRADLVGGTTSGLSSCSAFTTGVNFVSFSMNGASGNTVTMNIQTNPSPQNSYFYAPSATSIIAGFFGIPTATNVSMMTNNLSLQGTIAPINNSQGFEIRAFGPDYSYGHGRLIQLQVMTGSINSASVPFVLYYNSMQAASGTMNNCQAGTCLSY